MPTERHLYVHIPFCRCKCRYCAFASGPGDEALMAACVDAILTEAARLPTGPWMTIYCGGGTPTMLPPALLAQLLDGLAACTPLTTDGEWTVEANPDSADARRLDLCAEAGVNRLSLGVQSFDDAVLRVLGRPHDHRQALAAIDRARARFPRVSIDLLLGAPGEHDDRLAATLATLTHLDLGHASCYWLTPELGTPLHADLAADRITLPDDTSAAALLTTAWDGLTAQGLAQYETSNFARPGEESRHNLAVWRGADYHAVGPAAVSTVAGSRCRRDPDPARYHAAIIADGDAVVERETLDRPTRLLEYWMLGLRTATGVDETRLRELGDNSARYAPVAADLQSQGLVRHAAGRIALTRAGRLLQDAVSVALVPDTTWE